MATTTTTTTPSLPPTHRALVLHSTSIAPKVETVPTPQPGPGSIVVKVLNAGVISYMRDIYINNPRKYTFPLPLICGTNAIGRVASLGPDTVSPALPLNALVYIDGYIHAREDPTIGFISAIHDGYTASSKKLMADVWRDGTYAEYALVPLENVHPLNESLLLSPSGLNYTPEDLGAMSTMLVPYGGLHSIGLQPGETIIIAPATGPFGSAAVTVALAMGARVIAMGRNISILQSLAADPSGRVSYVPITGDVEADTNALKESAKGPIDAFFDISPPQAAGTTHIKSAILSLRHTGRVSLMGGLRVDVPIPHVFIVHFDITLKGKWMYDRKDIPSLIKMVEHGILKIGKGAGMKIVGKYGLEEWEAAFACAAENTGIGEKTVIVPWKGRE